MSPSVELSPETFARLQTHAVPLVDDIESVINRFVDYYEAKNGALTPAPAIMGAKIIRQFSPTTPPDLTHTHILDIEFCNRSFDQRLRKWNSLLIEAIRKARESSKSGAEFRRLVTVNFVEGQKAGEGYTFIRDLGISVQGQDANKAWRAACHIAQQLGCQLAVAFEWRHKDGAAFPGEAGQLSVIGR